MDTISVAYFSDFKARAIPIARAKLSRDSCSDIEARMNRPRSSSRGLGSNHLRANYTGVREVFRSTSVAKAISPTEGADRSAARTTVVGDRSENSNKYRPP